MTWEKASQKAGVGSFVVAIVIGVTSVTWWLMDSPDENSKAAPITTTIEEAQEPVVREPAPTKRKQSSPPTAAIPARQPLPQPIREDMDAYQVPVVRELIRQMGVSEIWLSQIMPRGRQGGLDGIPIGGAVDYSAAIKKLESRDEIEILKVTNRTYRDFGGESLSEDVRFRVKNLGPRERPQLRSPL